MSISNGIGNLQGLSNPVTPASATVQTGKEEQIKSSVSLAPGAVKTTPVTDQTVISSTSELLTRALSGSDVRLDKIQPLQAAIAAGTYQVSSSDLADKLITSLLK
ncbi:flagellar biosynthesis anti-sigma factor FlgM [Granulicella aggregans]|uniref:Negative regulator of flagellin synthesis n=1 Tax=Granulicella aggregans TaxID=474949 RepID=A0A7W7ZDM1_9BACT|nr:flagellar biosynthesis anti-sigma factor FlgM [Granulicella aggregans]MBB5057852.1 flagellar biosynthesis anti-sigma factor FlgM [Granulicella aggregans]